MYCLLTAFYDPVERLFFLEFLVRSNQSRNTVSLNFGGQKDWRRSVLKNAYCFLLRMANLLTFVKGLNPGVISKVG